ncbi:MAG: permease-like cell division protein FtsX [Clostridia bacterium]|nr:permease-like cell division protein FtsX [Clostridia bacterium]MBR4055014.1 permease-like cell division protein FtsX [Clostridia bacterium]
MRWFRSFVYNLKQGCKGIFRNSIMSTASVLVLLSCMIIVGTFYLVIANIEENFSRVDNLNVIEVRIPATYSDGQIEEIGNALSEIYKELTVLEGEPVFVSKEEHLRRFKEQYKDQEWSSFFDETLNPLRHSYELTFSSDADISEAAKIIPRIEAIKLSDGNLAVQSSDISSSIKLYENVAGIKKTLMAVGLWLMGILLIISLFVIMNTIKLGVFARRNEVMFMRYCGATKAFIRTPFLVEGVIIGLFSAALALGAEFLLYRYVLSGVVSSMTTAVSGSGIILSPYAEHLPLLGAVFCAIGLFAGLISGSISLKKYLKV